MRRAHYLTRDPVWFLPLVALVANVAMLAYFLVQVHTTKPKLRLSVAQPGRTTAAKAPAPVLEIGSNGKLVLEGQAIDTPLGLEFRLEELAARGTALVVRTAPKVDATAIAQAFQIASNAGFSDVLLETGE